MLRKGIGTAIFMLWAAFAGIAEAQTVVPDRIVPDTAVIRRQYEESNRFYDKLREISGDSRWAGRLYRALVSGDDRYATPASAETALEKGVSYFQQFEGRTINSIQIYRNNVFSDEYPRDDLRSRVNALHAVTRQNKIRRNVLFRTGQAVDPLVFARNEQMLRSLTYLSDAYILLQESAGGEGVDVYVLTRDSWSIVATMRSVPKSRRYLDVYDNNFLGSGNRFDVRTYVGFKGRVYGGNMLEYHASNLWGSFFQLDLIGGQGYGERRLGGTLNRDFIRASDFMAGGTLEYAKYNDRMALQDTIRITGRRTLDAWAGKSWPFPAAHGSVYLAGRYRNLDFFDRPEVKPDSNTLYHSCRALLLSAGIYRETYYRGNMIYGYGLTENIPYGHRFEVTAGRYLGEFGDRWYTAFNAVAGLQTGRGYFRAAGTVSSYWTEDRKPVRSALELELDGFSNLWKVRRSYVRQFFRLSYLNGFNRFSGEGEQVTFGDGADLHGLRNSEQVSGRVRLTADVETVLFTPIYFYGFRFVFFGFADFGWIGDRNMPFRNDFHTAMGAGVRLKNERLVFGTIQLRLGFAVNQRGWADYRHFRFSSQPSLQVSEFKAQPPELFEFR